ncbi:hypothetical protein [Streptomyces sp. NPDC051572]|uniref:hypothetical protein n=1 Tax=Streptomyces sp. NPDC051572 TaxID=3155802 RepID=UPI00344DA2CF
MTVTFDSPELTENTLSDLDLLAHQLATTVTGTPREEAAVWLLIEHGHWLPELGRVGLISVTTDPDRARIDWARTATDVGDLVGTVGEHLVLRVARSLARPEHQTDLNLSHLDESNRLLVLHAFAWAASGRAWAKSLGLLRGLRCGTCSQSLKGRTGKDVTAHLRLHGTNV